MIGIGNLLRQAREAKKLSLADVEKEIKIRSRYLEALEAEEFDVLPGNVYMFGFLRSYASFLGLDANDLVAKLRKHLQQDEEDAEDMKTRAPVYPPTTVSVGKKIKLLAVGLAVCLWIAYVVIYFMNQPVPQVVDPSLGQPAEETVQEQDTEDSIEATVEEPVFDGMELVLMVSNDPGSRCWVEVRADGETVFSGILEAGASQTFQAEERFWVKAGNAGVLSVNYNGEEFSDIGRVGEVVVLEFPPDNEL